MNESILRGFCQNCGLVCDYNVRTNCWESCGTIIPGIHGGCRGINHDVIGFLSPKQMITVAQSKEFAEKCEYGRLDTLYSLVVLLKDNPFLVAKILKESEK